MFAAVFDHSICLFFALFPHALRTELVLYNGRGLFDTNSGRITPTEACLHSYATIHLNRTSLEEGGNSLIGNYFAVDFFQELLIRPQS